ncbi:MAG: thioredoxin domain-containing protein [Gemmatimonadota bacterium]|nr:MAG: thioredoxin domain-containing protein [Gemmatimonadota bacterium]
MRMPCLLLAAVLVPGLLRTQDPDYRRLGSADAPLELAIYSDFECPYCRNFALAAMPAINAEFVDGGLVRVRYVYFPLAAVHRNAVASAKAAHCAGVAGKFWAFHDYLYVRQPEWAGDAAPDSLWIAYAKNLGLEPDAFAACLSAPETLAVVDADLRKALASGATGAPTIVLEGRSLAGLASYEELRAEILSAIAAVERQ